MVALLLAPQLHAQELGAFAALGGRWESDRRGVVGRGISFGVTKGAEDRATRLGLRMAWSLYPDSEPEPNPLCGLVMGPCTVERREFTRSILQGAIVLVPWHTPVQQLELGVGVSRSTGSSRWDNGGFVLTTAYAARFRRGAMLNLGYERHLRPILPKTVGFSRDPSLFRHVVRLGVVFTRIDTAH